MQPVKSTVVDNSTEMIGLAFENEQVRYGLLRRGKQIRLARGNVTVGSFGRYRARRMEVFRCDPDLKRAQI